MPPSRFTPTAAVPLPDLIRQLNHALALYSLAPLGSPLWDRIHAEWREQLHQCLRGMRLVREKSRQLESKFYGACRTSSSRSCFDGENPLDELVDEAWMRAARRIQSGEVRYVNFTYLLRAVLSADKALRGIRRSKYTEQGPEELHNDAHREGAKVAKHTGQKWKVLQLHDDEQVAWDESSIPDEAIRKELEAQLEHDAHNILGREYADLLAACYAVNGSPYELPPPKAQQRIMKRMRKMGNEWTDSMLSRRLDTLFTFAQEWLGHPSTATSRAEYKRAQANDKPRSVPHREKSEQSQESSQSPSPLPSVPLTQDLLTNLDAGSLVRRFVAGIVDAGLSLDKKELILVCRNVGVRGRAGRRSLFDKLVGEIKRVSKPQEIHSNALPQRSTLEVIDRT